MQNYELRIQTTVYYFFELSAVLLTAIQRRKSLYGLDSRLSTLDDPNENDRPIPRNKEIIIDLTNPNGAKKNLLHREIRVRNYQDARDYLLKTLATVQRIIKDRQERVRD